MTLQRSSRILVLTLAVAVLLNGCASKGLLTDRYDADEIAVPRLLPEDLHNHNPRFIVIGDEQKGRSVIEDFYRKENWATWWQLAVPFYQIYLLYNGISGGINYLRHVPDAGDETRTMMRDVLYRDVKELGATFVLETGDIAAADGRYPDHWEVFLEGKKWSHPFLSEIPYVPTIGNHEWANDTTYAWPNYQAVFDYPRFYALEFKSAVLIVLDSNFLVDQWELIPDDEQETLYKEWFVSGEGSSWLEQTLAKYADKPFKIVSMHHPPITYGWHWVDWYKDHFGRNLTDKRRDLLQLFADNGVQAVFSGHEHVYQHNPTHLLSGGDTHTIHFYTSSGGGVPIRSAPPVEQVEELRYKYRQEGLGAHQPTILSEYHYCLVSVEGDRLIIDTMVVDSEDSEHESSLFERTVIDAP
ncbi:metallophosphoesterase [bacterium]|nr:metallophosphoesterase [bacterium]